MAVRLQKVLVTTVRFEMMGDDFAWTMKVTSLRQNPLYLGGVVHLVTTTDELTNAYNDLL